MIRTIHLAIAASCLAAWMVSAEDMEEFSVENDDMPGAISVILDGFGSAAISEYVIDNMATKPICDAEVADEDNTGVEEHDANAPEMCQEPDVNLPTGPSVVIRYVDGSKLCRSCARDRNNRSCTIVQNIVCVGVTGDRTSVSIYVEGGFNPLDGLSITAD